MKRVSNPKNEIFISCKSLVQESEQVLQKKRRYIASYEDADAECYYTLGSWLS